tara:strand:- start:128 stop:385 length:258 start_codon:yes stop_codon:yes gene_type:complete
MPDITITITDNEKKCLDTVMVGIGTWALNSVQNRAHHAEEKILTELYAHCNKNGIPIGVGVTAQIDQAYAIGVAHTAISEIITNE